MRAAVIHKTIKIRNNQGATDYFVKIICLCNDLNPNIPDDL